MTCSACQTDAHPREAHERPELARVEAHKAAARGDYAVASMWLTVALTLLRRVELARRMAIGPMEVSSYERGAHRPRMQRLAMMAQVLGVSTSWLLFGEGEA